MSVRLRAVLRALILHPSVGVHPLRQLTARSIGNIGPLLSKEYPSCWKKYKTCSKTLTQARLCGIHVHGWQPADAAS